MVMRHSFRLAFFTSRPLVGTQFTDAHTGAKHSIIQSLCCREFRRIGVYKLRLTSVSILFRRNRNAPVHKKWHFERCRIRQHIRRFNKPREKRKHANNSPLTHTIVSIEHRRYLPHLDQNNFPFAECVSRDWSPIGIGLPLSAFQWANGFFCETAKNRFRLISITHIFNRN